ncbi:hypothetical protein MRX96_023468 [Rhipicephalus microplus]
MAILISKAIDSWPRLKTGASGSRELRASDHPEGAQDPVGIPGLVDAPAPLDDPGPLPRRQTDHNRFDVGRANAGHLLKQVNHRCDNGASE